MGIAQGTLDGVQSLSECGPGQAATDWISRPKGSRTIARRAMDAEDRDPPQRLPLSTPTEFLTQLCLGSLGAPESTPERHFRPATTPRENTRFTTTSLTMTALSPTFSFSRRETPTTRRSLLCDGVSLPDRIYS